MNVIFIATDNLVVVSHRAHCKRKETGLYENIGITGYFLKSVTLW